MPILTAISWFVGDRVFVSDLISCSPGDQVYGDMYAVEGTDIWTITSTNMMSGATIALNVTTQVEQAYAYIVLEAYYLVDCSCYPSDRTSEVFTDIVVQVAGENVKPEWEVLNNNPGSFKACGEQALADSYNVVEIDFQNTKGRL